jgi:phosphoribosylformylglycinamidine (FGAM) synthase-like enzyme
MKTDDIDATAENKKLPRSRISDNLANKLERKPTDPEASQFQSVQHHSSPQYLLNGTQDGEENQLLFKLTKKKHSKTLMIITYKDNVAFTESGELTCTKSVRIFTKKRISVSSLKAETHTFPTTVEHSWSRF